MNQPYSPDDIEHTLDSVSQALQHHLQARQIQTYALVGIHTGGAWVADALQQRLQATHTGTLDISFYRDDFTQKGLHPKVRPTALPFEVEGQHIVLVDDVLMTGRTIRAALNELFDYGRPASVTLVVLFDIGHRELPVCADICGESMALDADQRVELLGPQPLSARIIRRA